MPEGLEELQSPILCPERLHRKGLGDNLRDHSLARDETSAERLKGGEIDHSRGEMAVGK